MIPCEFNPIFKSYFADKLQDFLLNKRGTGCKYESESHILARLDKYFLEGNITQLDNDTLLGWIEKRESESKKTHLIRKTVLRQFCIFLNNRGMIIPLPLSQKASEFSKSFIPYIFTKEQIKKILESADTMTRRSSTSLIKLIMPVMLRLLYCCGLRITEATSLRMCNLDLKRGTITVLHSKNNNCRIVQMSPSLTLIIADYLNKIYTIPKDDDFVFPTKYNEQYDNTSIYNIFREILWKSGISHGGRGNGPRLHDLRHTFAVHSLQKLILEGKDTYLLLPILSTYLGHKNIYATEKYLRLTSEMYPDILEKVHFFCGNIMPEVVDYEAN